MIKEDVSVPTEDIYKILKQLSEEGKVLVSCPHCKNYLSSTEIKNSSCESCKSSFDKDSILYTYNSVLGQNN